MLSMKCPDCGCQRFYVKDPEDQYTIFEFDLSEGEIVPVDAAAETEALPVTEETETFCEQCAWHDRFKTLKK